MTSLKTLLIRCSIVCASLVSAHDCCAQFRVAEKDIVATYFFRGETQRAYAAKIENLAGLEVQRIASACDLSDSQIDKLNLAAKGDVSRFFRDLTEVREKTKDYNIRNQAEMQEAWKIMSPLYQRSRSGIFSGKSLLKRVVNRVLSADQSDRYDEYNENRRRRTTDAMIHLAVSDLDKLIPLTQKQRSELVKLLKKLPTPRRIDNNTQAQLGNAMLAAIKKDDIESILDDHQMKVVNALRAQYAGMVQLIR